MSVVVGRSSIAQIFCTHGPTATTTCSQPTGPWSVCTAVIAPELSRSKPVTVTPPTTLTSSASTLPSRPLSDAMLLAYPPRCSCRTLVMPWACQSWKMPFM